MGLGGNTYHLEVVGILETPVTRLAVILVVALRLHVCFGGALRGKLAGTSLARKTRCPVTQGIHMLLDCVYGTEHAGASVAFIPWAPVTSVVHVLLAGAGAVELPCASLALVHLQGDVVIPG